MVGYRSPPIEYQFKKGVSGNPAGRPKGSKRKPKPRRPFFDETLEITIAGRKHRLSRREALMRIAATFARKRKNLGLQRLLIELKEQLDRAQAHIDREEKVIHIFDMPAPPGHVSCIEDAADVLGFGKKAYLKCETGRVLLETWVIEAALAELGDRRLTRGQQELVLAAARFPKQVKWPAYWERDLRQRGKGWRAPKAPRLAQPTAPSNEVHWMSLREHLAWLRYNTPRKEIYLDELGAWRERRVYPQRPERQAIDDEHTPPPPPNSHGDT